MELNEGIFLLVSAVLANERKVDAVPGLDVAQAISDAIKSLMDRGIMRPVKAEEKSE